MSCGAFRRLLASFAAALSLSIGVAEVQAGGCGCEAPPCKTVYVHGRCHHHCRSCPPVGMVVPSMPVMPMMAMPMMMAPAMPVAAAPYAMAPPPVMAAAPQPTYQLTVAAPPAPTCMTQDQLVRALSAVLANEQSGVGAVRSPNMSTEERLAELERRVSKLEGQTKALEGNTKDIVEILKAMKDKAGN